MTDVGTVAAASLSLSGRYAQQGSGAARGLGMWAAAEGVELSIVDDRSDPEIAAAAYRRWMNSGIDIMLSPYGSDLVRAVARAVCESGRLLWNHGGSADDLAQPLLVSVPAPASTYLQRSVEIAFERGLPRILLARGKGRFPAAVAAGAQRTASRLGLDWRVCDLVLPLPADLTRTALLIIGTFEQDVAAVRSLRDRETPVGLIACVGAGLVEFGMRLHSAADGVLGPTQWAPVGPPAEVGPSRGEFREQYRHRFGQPPDYPAVQAAAAGYLAREALRRQMSPAEVLAWRTSTMLGSFGLDDGWRQNAHTPVTIEWQGGRQLVR